MSTDRAARRTVLFVEPETGSSEETAAARDWLDTLPDLSVRTITLAELPDTSLGYRSTIWFHCLEPPRPSKAGRQALDAHVRAGGGLLATLAAATLPARLGWEERAPDEAVDAAWAYEPEDDLAEGFGERPRMRGLQSFGAHPLFDGLGSGAYTWAPEAGERFVRYAYTGENWPKQGRVIAVQKSFIAMKADRRLAWEHVIGDGWVVCIGGYVHFAARDPKYRIHMERLLLNALDRVAPNGHRARLMGGAWERRVRGLEIDSATPLPPDLDAAGAFDVGDDLRLEQQATDAEYTLAGSRALLVGRENAGPREIWFHPFRAVCDWSLSATETADVATNGNDRSQPAAHVSLSPGVLTRRFELGGSRVEERTTVAPDAPAVLVELRPESGPVRLVWTMESDLRLMWPYPAGTTGRLSYEVRGGALGLAAETGEWLGVRIEPPPAALLVADASDEGRSRVRVTASLELSGPTRILLVGAGPDEDPPARVDPVAWAEARLSERRIQREEQFSLETDDRGLGEAVEWAKWRLSTYRVEVPGLGKSMVAGYGSSRPGAFGDGRPGYAWFFGRDACWTAFAALAVGQFDAARDVLEFLGRHQDISGKILHECTTSGVVHYDAADSTPLFLLLAARYFDATGDSETLEQEWPRILEAYEFCLSTDKDGDGLIENTGVGHGWVEFGRLGRNHVSLYLAGVWAAALADLEPVARALGRAEFADELAFRAAAARSSLELSFFDPMDGHYAHGRRADGSLDMAETIMTAVPLLLGVVRPPRCGKWLDRVAGDEFTAPWGVRLVPRSDPEYRPDGYHAGAVWPLFSGWASLAERRAGRLRSATRHWEQVARLYTEHSLGAWPEVLHGDEPTSIGVTSDQAWSTAMALLPMFGLDLTL
jgi:hypothetical protein